MNCESIDNWHANIDIALINAIVSGVAANRHARALTNAIVSVVAPNRHARALTNAIVSVVAPSRASTGLWRVAVILCSLLLAMLMLEKNSRYSNTFV